jgi:hypothetical protein
MLVVDMRTYQGLKSMSDLSVLVLASLGSRLRQIALIDDVLVELWIRSVCETQDVVKALRGRAMFVGELGQRYRGVRPKIVLVLIRVTQNEPARIVFFELQHDIRRELISSVLLTSKNRHLPNIEHGVPDFMQHHIGKWPEHRVNRAHPAAVVSAAAFFQMSSTNS